MPIYEVKKEDENQENVKKKELKEKEENEDMNVLGNNLESNALANNESDKEFGLVSRIQNSEEALNQLLNEALKSEISLENLAKGFNFDLLVPQDRQRAIDREAKQRSELYWKKNKLVVLMNISEEKKKEREEEVRKTIYGIHWFFQYLDEVLGCVVGRYGVTGFNHLRYRNLALSLFKALKKAKEVEIPRVVERKIKEWNEKDDVIPELVRAVSYVTAKLFIFWRREYHEAWLYA